MNKNFNRDNFNDSPSTRKLRSPRNTVQNTKISNSETQTIVSSSKTITTAHVEDCSNSKEIYEENYFNNLEDEEI